MSTQGISYELALRLKNAGFPQPNWKEVEGRNFIEKYYLWKTKNKERIFMPTLSELIEACGVPISIHGFKNDYWSVKNGTDSSKGIITEGLTFEMAVANLWLALHEKHEKVENKNLHEQR